MVEIKSNQKSSEHDRVLVWVAKAAVLDDGTRYFFKSILFVRSSQHAHVTAVATDGRRVHMADLGAGYVESIGGVINEPDAEQWVPTEIAKRTKTAVTLSGPNRDARYPDYRRVIPEPAYWVDLPERIATGINGPDEFLLSHLLITLQDANHLIPRFRTKYIDEMSEMAPVKVGFTTPDHAFLFKSADDDPFERRAVVMPMKRTNLHGI